MAIPSLAAWLLASLALVPAADAPLGERFAKIRRDYEARDKKFSDDLVAARHDDRKITDLNDVYREDWLRSIADAKALMRSHPDDPAAFDGALLVVGPLRSFLDNDLVPIASKYALVDPRAGEFAFSLRSRDGEDYAETILHKVASKHPRREVRGQAAFALGDYYRNTGLPYGRKLPESEEVEWLRKAEICYMMTRTQFADVPTPDGKTSLGIKAKAEIARLHNRPNLKIGKPAPEIVGVDLDGKPLKLSDHRGKVVVVCFWATWCGPCMAMVPHERELVKQLEGKPFALLGVNCDEPGDKAKVRATLKEKSMTWPSWWDGDRRGPIQTAYDVPHWPMVYVIDPKGVIRAVDVRGKDLDAAVDKLLAGPESMPENNP